MRKSARALALVFLTLLSSIALGVISAITAALTLAATALIVPGTGTHNITTVMGYKENARDRFMTTTPCVGNGCNLVGIDYPASFFPFGFPPFPASWCPGLSCKTWNESVGEGVTNLATALAPFIANPDPANPVVVFGYSQGGAVVSHEMYNLANLPQSTKDTITVVTIGNIENPQGLWSRLSFLPTIPILNITFGPQLPTNIGIKSVNYVFEYDPVGDAPLYWGNPLAMLNALAAFQYVHGQYLVPNSNAPDEVMPYGYTDATLAAAISNPNNIRTYQDATFVLIPQQGTLPIFQPLADMLPSQLSKPIIDLLSPVTKVLINLGYDRTLNPGIPQTLSILPFNPFQNWLGVGIDLVAASIQGVQAFVNDIVNTVQPLLPALAPTTNPTTPTPTTLSTLAAPQQLSLTQATEPQDEVSTNSLKTEPKENTRNSPASISGNLLTSVPPQPLSLVANEPKTPTVKSGNLFTPGSTSSSQSQSQSQGATQGATPSTTTTTNTTTATTTNTTTTNTTPSGDNTAGTASPAGNSESSSSPAAA